MLFRSSFKSEAMPGKRQVVTCYLRALPAETLCWWKGCLLYTRHFFWLSKFELILYILLMRFCARCPPKFPQEKRRGSKSEVTSFSSFLKCSSCHKLRSVTLMGDRSFHPWVRLQQHFCGDLLNVSQFIYRIIRSSLFSVNLSQYVCIWSFGIGIDEVFNNLSNLSLNLWEKLPFKLYPCFYFSILWNIYNSRKLTCHFRSP